MATEQSISHYERINRIKEYIRQHMDEPLNREELAQLAGYSISPILFHRKEPIMQPMEIRTLPDLKVLYARATEMMTSPAFQRANQEAFGKLFRAGGDLMKDMKQCVAIYPDEVEVGKVARFDAGAIFAQGQEPSAPAGLANQTLAGGRWAVFRHVGPYDTLWQTWQAAYRDWLPTSGEEVRNTIPFEDYLTYSHE